MGPGRESIGSPGYAAARHRNVPEVNAVRFAHADTLVFPLAPANKKLAQLSRACLRSSSIPPRPAEMIAGQITDGVRRIELTSGHDCGNYKLPPQQAHTCILLS